MALLNAGGGTKYSLCESFHLRSIAPSGIEPKNSPPDCFLYGSTLTGFEPHTLSICKKRRYQKISTFLMPVVGLEPTRP